MKLERRVLRAFLCAAAIAVGASGPGCMQPAVVIEERELDVPRVEFETCEAVLGFANRPTVLTGFLLGGAVADLAFLRIDDGGERQLRLFAFGGGTWSRALDATLDADVRFADVAKIDGEDRLIFYAPGRLGWFDPASASERELVAVTSSFDPPRKDEVPHVDVTRDVNGDGRDDLVVPDADGFRVFVQIERGAFADPVTVGPPTEMSRILGADGYRYDPWGQSRVHEIDFDQDGLIDLAFWNEDRFEVHTQNARGLFEPVAETFRTDVAFDSDGLSTLATGDMQGRALHSLADLNGDGVADLVVYTLEGRRSSKKRSSYEVHFGEPTPAGGTAFEREVGVRFETDDRVQIGMHRRDFDGDGQVDVLLTTIHVKFLERSLWKNLKGAMGDDVLLELEVYRMEDGRFADEPDFKRILALDGPPSHREPGWVPLDLVLRGGTHERRRTQKGYANAFNTTLRIGDLNGDGRADLLASDHPRALQVGIGLPAPELFSSRPQRVTIPVPNDEEYISLVDLDADGKQDILMHYPFTLRDGHGRRKMPPGSEPHRVAVLFAR